MNYEMLDRNKLNELDAYIESFEDKPSHLIMILHRAQGLFGYLPKELQIYVAEKIRRTCCESLWRRHILFLLHDEAKRPSHHLRLHGDRLLR